MKVMNGILTCYNKNTTIGQSSLPSHWGIHSCRLSLSGVCVKWLRVIKAPASAPGLKINQPSVKLGVVIVHGFSSQQKQCYYIRMKTPMASSPFETLSLPLLIDMNVFVLCSASTLTDVKKKNTGLCEDGQILRHSVDRSFTFQGQRFPFYKSCWLVFYMLYVHQEKIKNLWPVLLLKVRETSV